MTASIWSPSGVGPVVDDIGFNDGVTDNYEIFNGLFSFPGDLVLNTGTYLVNFPVGQQHALSSTVGRTIRGNHRNATILKFVVNDVVSALRACFYFTKRITIRDITIQIVNNATDQTCVLTGTDINNILFIDAGFDGGVTDDGVTASHTSYGVVFPSTVDTRYFHMERCFAHSFHWFLQKSNANTRTQSSFRLLNNEFYNFYRTPVQFNTPLGRMEDIIIDGNNVRDNRGVQIGLTNCFHFALMGNNIKCINNLFSGPVEYAIHVEEVGTNVVISGNSGTVGDSSYGTGFVRLINNNNSGVLVGPRKVTITDNIVEFGGVARALGSRGVLINSDGDRNTADATKVIIANNRMELFEQTYTVNARMQDDIIVDNNVAREATVGFRSVGAPITINNNKSRGCTYGVGETNGLIAKNHTFSDCTNLGEVTARWITLINPQIEFSEFSVGAGSTTYKNIFASVSANRCSGAMVGHVTNEISAETAFRYSFTKWDGTTATITSDNSRQSAAFTLAFVNNAGFFAAQMAATNARTYVALSVHVIGAIELGA